MSFALAGSVIVLLAALGGMVIVRRKFSEQPTPAKAVLFGLCFWGLVFLQVLVFGLLLR